MAKSIGKFAVNIGANTRGFSSGLSRASRLSAGFSKSLGGMAMKVAGVAAAFLALRSVFRGVSAQFEAVDKIAKFSKQTGVATESLAAFSHAGQLAGVSNEIVNKGIQRMARQIGEANSGVKTAARGFEMLGLKTKELTKVTPEEQFGMVAEKIKAIVDPAERAAAAYGVFGRAGQDMIPMLMGGSAAISQARKEAELLGMTFSAVDAAKVEESNDAWTRVKTALSGVARMFTVHLAPVFTTFSENAVEMSKVIIAKLKEWGPVFHQFANVAISMFKAVWESVSTIFTSVFGVISANMGSAKDFVIDALISMEFRIKNFGTIAGLAFTKMQILAVEFGATIAHFFTGTLPALFGWFVDNWANMWTTAFDFAITVLTNYGKNVRSQFEALWHFIKTGEWEVAFIPLLEGFKNTIGELPKLPEREIGPLESGLREEAKRIQHKLDADFEVFRDKRREELLGGAEIKAPELKLPEIGLGTGAEKKADTAAAGGIAALERGSSAAFSAIAKQIRGASAERREEANLDANERAADAAERMADQMEDNPTLQPAVI